MCVYRGTWLASCGAQVDKSHALKKFNRLKMIGDYVLVEWKLLICVYAFLLSLSCASEPLAIPPKPTLVAKQVERKRAA
jgi:hypothetical protein